jgi:hypothetical protein
LQTHEDQPGIQNAYRGDTDRDPDRAGLVVAAGDSGHGFKFAPVLGPLIADVVERRPNAWAPRFAWRARVADGKEAARAMYSAYMTSDDQNIRAQAVERLKQLRSLDEIDAINAMLASYREQTGACPSGLRVFAPRFRAMNLAVNDQLVPIDPDGFAYTYDAAKCKAELSFESTVSR